MQLECEYESYEGSLSITNSVCSRLVSSSPPESFANSYRLPLSAARASSRSPRPAVLLVSDEVSVQDVQLPAPIATNTPLAVNPVSLREPKRADGERDDRPVSSEGRQRTRSVISLVLAVSLLVLGGVVVPVSWAALLHRTSGALGRSPHVGCYSIQTRLQFTFVTQGLLLSLSGILLVGCWAEDCASLDKTRQLPRWLSAVAVVLSYTAVLVSLCFIVWQILSGTVDCRWSPGVYAVLVSLELLVTLTSALSTGIVCVLTFSRK